MELDDNHIETDNRKETRSPTDVLSNPECSEKVPPPAETSKKLESSELKIPSSTEAYNNSEKVPSPPEASNNEELSELKVLACAETLNNPECSENLPSLTELSNKGDSSQPEIPTAAEQLSNPKYSEKLPTLAEASNGGDSSELEIPTATENLNNSKSSEKLPSPAKASNKEESSELEISTAAEELNIPKCSEKVSSPSEESNKGESSELKVPSSAEGLSFLLSEPSTEEVSGPKPAEKKMTSSVVASKQPDLSERKTFSPAGVSKSGKKTASPAGASKSAKKTRRSLKGKAKIVKKSPLDDSLKASEGASSSQITGKKRKGGSRGTNEYSNKRVRGNNEGSNKKDGNKLKESQQNISEEEHGEKNHQAPKTPAIKDLEKSQQKPRNKEKRHGSDKSAKSQKTSEKPGEKTEKLGGLIFMCSGKTKPDCFHYRIMGVSMGKKDLVLGIKPGLKLFLYDFDLKLLYGIYKASSSGRLKIEPKAFGGAFPAQVRFTVEKDCLPLPESVFKQAIKETYNETNKKFKTELTVRQVRKLTALFRPAQVHSSVLSPRSPRESKVRGRGVKVGVHRDAHTRDPYANGDDRRYPVLAHERDEHAAYREEPSRDLYLTEKEYRTYGLRGERRNATSHFPRNREYERDHLVRQPHLVYRDAVHAHREHVHSGPLYLSDKDYPGYSIGGMHELRPATSATAVYARDPYYHYHYGASSSDPHLGTHRREDIPLGSYSVAGRRDGYRNETTSHVLRRETDLVERSLYSREAAVAADASLRYNQTDRYQVAKPEVLPAPVSSRYAFAGPSYSYR